MATKTKEKWRVMYYDDKNQRCTRFIIGETRAKIFAQTLHDRLIFCGKVYNQNSEENSC